MSDSNPTSNPTPYPGHGARSATFWATVAGRWVIGVSGLLVVILSVVVAGLFVPLIVDRTTGPRTPLTQSQIKGIALVAVVILAGMVGGVWAIVRAVKSGR